MKKLLRNSGILLGLVLIGAFTFNFARSSAQQTASAERHMDIASAPVSHAHVADFAKCGDGKDTGEKAKKEDTKAKDAKAKDAKCGDGKCGDGKCGTKDKKDTKKKAAKKDKDAKCGAGKCGK